MPSWKSVRPGSAEAGAASRCGDPAIAVAQRISVVARRLGVTLRALRHYEAEGLIVPLRASGGVRYFTSEEVVRLERIVLLRQADLPLDAIRRVMGRLDTGGASEAEEMRSAFEARAATLEAQLTFVRRTLDALEALDRPAAA